MSIIRYINRKQKTAVGKTDPNLALIVSHLLHSQVFCSSSYYKHKQRQGKDSMKLSDTASINCKLNFLVQLHGNSAL